MNKVLFVLSVAVTVFPIMHCSKKCVGTGVDCPAFSPDTIVSEGECKTLQATIVLKDSTTRAFGNAGLDCSVTWK
jgi:hypothetical protein